MIRLFGKKKARLLLSKKELNDCLLDLIDKSQKTLKIVSPYINLYSSPCPYKCDGTEYKYNCHLREALEKKKSILEVYTRKPKTEDEHKENVHAISSLNGIIDKTEIVLINNLHVKLYISENAILLTSMNLLCGSLRGSLEAGILFDRSESEYRDIINYFNNNIYIYKYIYDYFHKRGINVEFLEDGRYGNEMRIMKDNDSYVSCWVGEVPNDDSKVPAYFRDIPCNFGSITGVCFDVNDYENHKNTKEIRFYIEIKNDDESFIKADKFPFKVSEDRIGSKNKPYLTIEKGLYDTTSLIPIINAQKEELLEKLMCCYKLLET